MTKGELIEALKGKPNNAKIFVEGERKVVDVVYDPEYGFTLYLQEGHKPSKNNNYIFNGECNL